MILLPIVQRELGAAARNPATYWTRFSITILAMIVSGYCLFMGYMVGFRAFAGPLLFQSVTLLAGAYCYLGALATSDAISREKRDGTLGLLFLTQLRGYDIIFGKLVSTSISGIYGLMAIFPVLAIPLLIGGIPVTEFARTVLALLNQMFFAVSAGLCVSAASHNERKAAGAAVFILFLALAGPTIVVETLKDLGIILSDYVYTFGLRYAQTAAAESMYARHAPLYWTSLGIIHAVGWVFLATASIIVRHSWQHKAVSRKGEKWENIWRKWTYGAAEVRLKLRRRFLSVNPYFWLASRNIRKPLISLLTIGGLVVYFIFAFGRQQGWRTWWEYLLPMFIFHLLLKTMVASEAGRRFVEDRQSGAFEMILATPLGVRDILSGQWRALARQFAPVFLFLLLIDLVLLGGGLTLGMTTLRQYKEFLILYSICFGVFLLDLYTLGWVGMWAGSTLKVVKNAVHRTFLLVLMGPWLVFGVASALWNLAQWRLKLSWSPPFLAYVTVWTLIAVIIDLVLISYTRPRLLRDFRRNVERGGAVETSFWRRLIARRANPVDRRH